MPNARLAGRYAKSLLDLATEQGQLEAVYADMKYIQAACNASSEFVNMLRSPIIKADQKNSIINEVLKNKVGVLTNSFTVLLVKKGRELELPEMATAFIEQYKSSADIELGAAKKKYKEAYDAGDPDALADAQADITRATLKAERVQSMKPIEVEEKEYDSTPAAPQMAPRTAKWVQKNNSWWGKDEEMTMAATGLDKKLAREYGPEYVGTEEYFQTIDKTMRKRFPEHFEDAQSDEEEYDPPPRKRSEPAYEDETPRRATKPSSVVAPATRSTPPNRIKLKASEAAIARRLGVTLDQYAKQVALLERNK